MLDVDASKIRWPDGVGSHRCTAFVDNAVATDFPYYMYLKGLSNVKRVVVGSNTMDTPDMMPLSIHHKSGVTLFRILGVTRVWSQQKS